MTIWLRGDDASHNLIPLDQLQTVSAALHLSTIVEILTVVFESAAVLKLPARIANPYRSRSSIDLISVLILSL